MAMPDPLSVNCKPSVWHSSAVLRSSKPEKSGIVTVGPALITTVPPSASAAGLLGLLELAGLGGAAGAMSAGGASSGDCGSGDIEELVSKFAG